MSGFQYTGLPDKDMGLGCGCSGRNQRATYCNLSYFSLLLSAIHRCVHRWAGVCMQAQEGEYLPLLCICTYGRDTLCAQLMYIIGAYQYIHIYIYIYSYRCTSVGGNEIYYWICGKKRNRTTTHTVKKDMVDDHYIMITVNVHHNT